MSFDFDQIVENHFKEKRDILFAWPVLKQEPTYIFYFIRDLITIQP